MLRSLNNGTLVQFKIRFLLYLVCNGSEVLQYASCRAYSVEFKLTSLLYSWAL